MTPGRNIDVTREFRGRALRLGGVGLAMVLLVAAGASAADQSGWFAKPTANRGGENPNYLYGVSCTSRSTCSAVGIVSTASLHEPTLAMRWDGTRWRVESAPVVRGGSIDAISCTSGSACTAVGDYYPPVGCCVASLVERWNGTKWHVQPSLSPANQNTSLFGVSCTSSRACTAVGSSYPNGGASQTTFVERWNGSKWQIEQSPNSPGRRDTGFLGVSCASSRACMAVRWSAANYGPGRPGGPEQALVERWTSAKWVIEATPATHLPSALDGVSCVSTGACVAVGSFPDGANATSSAGALVERWDGVRWHVEQSTSTGEQLDAVSCTSAQSCTAVGSVGGMTLAERWNGADWTVQQTPTLRNAHEDRLSAVSCTSAQSCTAVGDHATLGGGPAGVLIRTLAEQWNGG
jgi:hypothetical protein